MSKKQIKKNHLVYKKGIFSFIRRKVGRLTPGHRPLYDEKNYAKVISYLVKSENDETEMMIESSKNLHSQR